MNFVLPPSAQLISAMLLALAASVDEPESIDGLVKCSDCVVRALIQRTEEVPGGLVHTLKVEEPIWGDSGGNTVLVFTLRNELPDTPGLQVDEDCIVGIRWIDAASPRWAVRLGVRRDVDPLVGAPPRIGVLVADGKLAAQGRESLIQETSEWILMVRGGKDSDVLESAAAKLLGHEASVLRKSAMDALAETLPPLCDSTAERIRGAHAREILARRDSPCLRSCLNLMRLRNVSPESPSDSAQPSGSTSSDEKEPRSVAASESPTVEVPCLAEIVLEKMKQDSAPFRSRKPH